MKSRARHMWRKSRVHIILIKIKSKWQRITHCTLYSVEIKKRHTYSFGPPIRHSPQLKMSPKRSRSSRSSILVACRTANKQNYYPFLHVSSASGERRTKGRRIVSYICSSKWMGAGRCKGTRRESETEREE